MPFQFQQFAVDDTDCAMKVGTDGIVLGAWARIPKGARSVLDVGTGSGLLALMLAQRFASVDVHAIEIDQAAAESADRNFAASPWANRLVAEHVSLQEFADKRVSNFDAVAGASVSQTERRVGFGEVGFDAIVCNPPFFDDSMRPRLLSRRTARHQDTLNTAQLFQSARQLLLSSGTMSIVIPTVQADAIVQAAASVGLYVNRETTISTLPGRPPSRVLFEFGNEADAKAAGPTIEHLVLEESHHQRSAEYVQLAADFFLKP